MFTLLIILLLPNSFPLIQDRVFPYLCLFNPSDLHSSVFWLFDDKGKLVAPANSKQAAKVLAEERGVKNQNVISAEVIKEGLSRFSTDELKGMLRYLGIEKD